MWAGSGGVVWRFHGETGQGGPLEIKAVDVAGRLLGTRGRVLPASAGAVRLEGETVSGERISGESRIGAAPAAIRRVWLDLLHRPLARRSQS